MPSYEIYFGCSECGGEHPILMKVFLPQGPEDKRSVVESFGQKEVPPQLSAVRGHKALCRRTGRVFYQDQYEKIFLVPAIG